VAEGRSPILAGAPGPRARAAALALLLLAGACGEPAGNAIERQAQLDREIDRLRRSTDPCTIDEGDGLRSRRYRDCLDLLPQERMHGIWYFGFEESGFVANATSAPRVRVIGRHGNPEFDTFLELDEDAVWRLLGGPLDHIQTRAIALDFIGRRSRRAGAYYTGEGNHVVVVDRLISARMVGEVESLVDCRAFQRPPQGMRCAPGSNPQPLEAVR
jgi:hypothetical protein